MTSSVADLPVRLQADLRTYVQAASSLYRAAAASVALLTPDQEMLRFVAAHGAGERAVTGMRVSRGTGIAGFVLSSGTTLAVADVTADPRFSLKTAQSTGYVPSVILAAPLIVDGEAIGVTEVLDPSARERDLDLLAVLGSMLALLVAQDPPRLSELDVAVDAVQALGPESTGLAVQLLQVLAARRWTYR